MTEQGKNTMPPVYETALCPKQQLTTAPIEGGLHKVITLKGGAYGGSLI